MAEKRPLLLFRRMMRASYKFNSRILLIISALACALLIFIYIVFMTPGREYVRGIQNFIQFNKSRTGKEACHIPQLDPFNPDLNKYLKTVEPLQCSKQTDWLTVTNGSVFFDDNVLKARQLIRCQLSYLKRESDFKSVKGATVFISSREQTSQTLRGDFFWAECEDQASNKWNKIMSGIHRDEDAVRRAQDLLKTSEFNNIISDDQAKLNVLMFGFDSLSRMHFPRKLPLTYEYLKETLSAIVLKGYNIVGDGTPQALIPILTSYAEPELPETRKRKSNANYVNVYPFAWKNFTKYGYVTAFAEDTPSVGIFTYRLKGFDAVPTDHYMRQFYVAAEGEYRKNDKLCLGSIPRHNVMMNWIREMHSVYNDVPKFSFGFHGEISHDDYNLVQCADKDIKEWLKSLKDSGILDNTILIMMSDHGHRFASIRETQQGKQEERLPFFSFVLPEWFKTKYPNAYTNMVANAEDRLTTPFDIHATMMTVLTNFYYGEDVKAEANDGSIMPRSMSLFEHIPKDRTCADAVIEAHWCTCLQWEQVPTNNAIAVQAAQAVIDFINELTSNQRSKCARLLLDRVTRAELMSPNKALLAYKKNSDPDGFLADLSDNTKVSEVVYQVQTVAYPSQAIYEASLKYNAKLNSFVVREAEISRVNMYGSQPHCVYESLPNLRKYCYCKIQLE